MAELHSAGLHSAGLHSVDGLDIDEDLALQRKEWRVSRVAWCGFSLLLAGGLAGLFGSGPLSHAEVSAPGLTLDYERFNRRSCPGVLRFQLTDVAAAEEASVWIERAYLQHLRLGPITPEPASVRSEDDRIVYQFRPGPSAERSGELSVEFRFEHLHAGRIVGHAGRVGAESLAFAHLVYP